MNSVLSPIVQGVHGILEEQTFDMNEYREQKDKLEYEALMRNPETAYLASDEEFDRQLDELGWSPSDLVTMTGMYMDRAAYNIKKSVRDWFRELLELMFAAAAIVFLIIGIVGYFTIPTVAGWIIQAGGGIGSYNKNIGTAGALGGSVAGAAVGNVAGRAGKLIKGTAGKVFKR